VAPAPPVQGRTHPPKPAPPPVVARPKRSLAPILGLAALAAAGVIALVIFIGSRRTDEGTLSGGNTGTPPPTTSTTTIPPDKTPEEVFQEHFAQAQVHLEAQNPAAAQEENARALAALPDDPRGLAQQKGIQGILNPPPPEPIIAGNKPPVDPNVKPDGDKAVRDKMEEGRRALDERRFADAIALLEETGRLAGPGNAPPELNDLLTRAKSGRAEDARRQQQTAAQKALDEARASVGSDVIHAFQKLREARNALPDLPGIAEVEASVQQQARKEGEAALALAKNRDNGGRTDEAIKYYERTITLLDILSGGHDGIALSRQRLQQLRGK
jgi:tetratricopeptide (TPR) repeat protein